MPVKRINPKSQGDEIKEQLAIKKKYEDELKKEYELKQLSLQEEFREIFTPGYTKSLLKDVIKESKRKFKESKDFDTLHSAYKNEKLVFVLGAGISMNYGLPSWDTLLQKLMVTTIKKEQSASSALSKLFTELFSPSPLIAGRFLQKFYENKSLSFEESVRSVLYSEITMRKTSPLMDEIVKFCVAAGKSPNLDSIITYNFDDLVEQHLQKTNVEIPFRSIHGVGMNPETGELPLYHVHGYLPQEGVLDENNQITFGENVYHKQYNDIYSWNNIVQINKFRDFTCLFIGSSLTDPNIRRLLDIARIQRGEKQQHHFIFKKRYKLVEIEDKLKNLITENKILFEEKNESKLNFDETVKYLTKTIEEFEQNDTLSFGVQTIWIDDYFEIPEILREIRTKKDK
jgi:hypothetical protein